MSDARGWQGHRRREAEDYEHSVQDADEQRAEATCDYLVRFAEQIGAAPTGGTARLAWGPKVSGATVVLDLPDADTQRAAMLRADVGPGRPEVHLWFDGNDLGVVETATDVGLALLGRPTRPPEPQAVDEPDVGAMLHMVLEGIVRDVVTDVLDGRLGRGSPT